VRQIVQTAQFKKDLKKVALSGRHQAGELFEIVARLARDEAPFRKTIATTPFPETGCIIVNATFVRIGYRSTSPHLNSSRWFVQAPIASCSSDCRWQMASESLATLQ
jgi:hypothetical protein